VGPCCSDLEPGSCAVGPVASRYKACRCRPSPWPA
jgi:hypothetical protein